MEQDIFDAGYAMLEVLDLTSHFMKFGSEHAPHSDLDNEQAGPNSNGYDQFRAHSGICSGVWTRTGAPPSSQGAWTARPCTQGLASDDAEGFSE
jgi:hypothetical protein